MLAASAFIFGVLKALSSLDDFEGNYRNEVVASRSASLWKKSATLLQNDAYRT